ncbi:cation diffusion facilitator family transporter [Tannerella sp.]|uniref:cation diffusion facilitator family transporter n=1 Tax=Tannerella sp. TaxID=2382127 RepID=UPI0026DD8B8D|nr:cation diffusion facilitator family transporter [Tannerella sp.]MDO4704008.1 cation diffusion facilitator family transporter [Tannerella sp.]
MKHSHEVKSEIHGHHTHDHHHHHAHHVRGRKLLWVTLLNFSITIVQVVGGVFSNSLSLISDAIHNLGDSSAIFIAFLAGKHAEKQPDERKTFGYKRIEILAALFNAVVLIAICIYLFFEAYQRFMEPEPIKGKVMLIVAVFGLLANLISVVVLHKDKSHNLNVRAAYLHLLGDTLSSVAVIAGGIAIWIWNLYWLDPLITVLVGLYIIRHTWSIVQETVNILMQATPDGIDINMLKRKIEEFPEVENMHHLHVWRMDDEHVHLEAHVNIRTDCVLSAVQPVRQRIERMLLESFGINHITLQIEYKGCQGEDGLIHQRTPICSAHK